MNLIYGRKPVLEAINAGKSIEQVMILFGQQGPIIETIMIAAKRRGIKCNFVKSDRFRQFAEDKNTQGVIAKIGDFKYSSLDKIISLSKQKKYPLVLILDSIQDPHNLGAIIRTAECSGVDGVILSKHNSASVNDTVIKTSAGAVEHMHIALENNLNNTIDELKKNGYWIFGSSLGERSVDYVKTDYKMPVALVLGNEEKGIKPLIAKHCDFLIKIPMVGKIQSLNVSVAAGAILFEILKQRNQIED